MFPPGCLVEDTVSTTVGPGDGYTAQEPTDPRSASTATTCYRKAGRDGVALPMSGREDGLDLVESGQERLTRLFIEDGVSRKHQFVGQGFGPVHCLGLAWTDLRCV